MGYFDDLENKNNIIILVIFIFFLLFFIITDLVKDKISIVTIAYSLLFVASLVYLVIKLRKKK